METANLHQIVKVKGFILPADHVTWTIFHNSFFNPFRPIVYMWTSLYLLFLYLLFFFFSLFFYLQLTSDAFIHSTIYLFIFFSIIRVESNLDKYQPTSSRVTNWTFTNHSIFFFFLYGFPFTFHPITSGLRVLLCHVYLHVLASFVRPRYV